MKILRYDRRVYPKVVYNGNSRIFLFLQQQPKHLKQQKAGVHMQIHYQKILKTWQSHVCQFSYAPFAMAFHFYDEISIGRKYLPDKSQFAGVHILKSVMPIRTAKQKFMHCPITMPEWFWGPEILIKNLVIVLLSRGLGARNA